MSRRSLLLSTLVALGTPRPSRAAVALDLRADDVSGRWSITETRAGNQCVATLSLSATSSGRSSETVLGAQRGSARFSGPCVDPAMGTWTAQEGGSSGPRLASRLEYEKSSVFYSLGELTRENGGALRGKGEIYVAPRSDPNALRRVGKFDARRVEPTAM